MKNKHLISSVIIVGLLALAFSAGVLFGRSQTEVTVSLEERQKNSKQKFTFGKKKLHKVCTLLYFDDEYGSMCFCKIDNGKRK